MANKYQIVLRYTTTPLFAGVLTKLGRIRKVLDAVPNRVLIFDDDKRALENEVSAVELTLVEVVDGGTYDDIMDAMNKSGDDVDIFCAHDLEDYLINYMKVYDNNIIRDKDNFIVDDRIREGIVGRSRFKIARKIVPTLFSKILDIVGDDITDRQQEQLKELLEGK